MNKLIIGAAAALLGLAALTGCAASSGPAGDGTLSVVATTTLVGDVVRNVGGSDLAVTVMIPEGVDEHGFEPAPRDIALVSQADLVFYNGAGLEEFIERLAESAGGEAEMVAVSEGVTLLKSETAHTEGDAKEEEHSGDPHVWMDPNNVILWVDAIERALAEKDPQNAEAYRENADRYRQQLRDLDRWIAEQTGSLPEANRRLVTDHTVFTYFAARYGFRQVGAVVPGYSTVSESSAQELAALEDAIREQGVPVIFTGNTVNPALAERVAEDTGTRLVPILTGSLTGKDGPGATYLDYMRYNVQAIVEALQ